MYLLDISLLYFDLQAGQMPHPILFGSDIEAVLITLPHNQGNPGHRKARILHLADFYRGC